MYVLDIKNRIPKFHLILDNNTAGCEHMLMLIYTVAKALNKAVI
jgi:hypothetical protein